MPCIHSHLQPPSRRPSRGQTNKCSYAYNVTHFFLMIRNWAQIATHTLVQEIQGNRSVRSEKKHLRAPWTRRGLGSTREVLGRVDACQKKGSSQRSLRMDPTRDSWTTQRPHSRSARIYKAALAADGRRRNVCSVRRY